MRKTPEKYKVILGKFRDRYMRRPWSKYVRACRRGEHGILVVIRKPLPRHLRFPQTFRGIEVRARVQGK